MDWLTFTSKIEALEARLMPLRIVKAESSGVDHERVLEGVVGGFKVYPGEHDRVWTSDGAVSDLE